MPAALAAALVGLFGAGSAVAAEPEPIVSEPVEATPVEPEIHPSDPDADLLDVERGEPAPARILPPEGMAHRPGMPSLDRDLIAPHQSMVGRGTAVVELSRIGEDLFLDVNLVYVIKADEWRIAPRLPLRLRLVDEEPKTTKAIRTEDWDEPSDWARVLAFVQYGGFGQPVFFRYGELNGVTIGHGALVNRYFNSVDIDHYQGGVFAMVDLDFAGGEVLLDNVFGPEIFVGRGYVRPFSLIEGWARPLRLMKFGVTAGADFTAPLAVATSNGSIYAHPDWQPIVLADEVAGLFSVDLEVPAVSTPHFDLVPYLDVATVDGKGAGLHAGSFVNVRFDTESSLRTRLEYRYEGSGYEAGYVSPFYEIQRYSHLGGDPKLAQLRHGEIAARGRHGFYLETELRYRNALRYGLIYAHRGERRGHDLLMRLRLRELGPVQLTLMLARLGFSGFDNLFAADRTMWGATVRVTPLEWLFVRASVVNEWWLVRDASGTGGFETTTNFSFGVGLIIRP